MNATTVLLIKPQMVINQHHCLVYTALILVSFIANFQLILYFVLPGICDFFASMTLSSELYMTHEFQ